MRDLLSVLLPLAVMVSACRAAPSDINRAATVESIAGEYLAAGYPELDLRVNSDLVAELQFIWRTDKTATASYKGTLDKSQMMLVVASPHVTLNIPVAVVAGGLVLILEDFDIPGRVPYLLERRKRPPIRVWRGSA